MKEDSTLKHIYTDHLGSTGAMSNSSGAYIANSLAMYTPFGGWRTEPSATAGDRYYTSHKHNNLGGGADDLGLIYMNARFYIPGVARFASADTIVPNSANGQSYNRYSYTLNNPIKYTDPSGHCEETGDDTCWSAYDRVWAYVQANPDRFSFEGSAWQDDAHRTLTGTFDEDQLDMIYHMLTNPYTSQPLADTLPGWRQNGAKITSDIATGMDIRRLGGECCRSNIG